MRFSRHYSPDTNSKQTRSTSPHRAKERYFIMIDRKLNEFGIDLFKDLIELDYRQAEDIKEVFEYDYNYMGKSDIGNIYVIDCMYEISNTIYDDTPYAKLIDIAISDMIIVIDDTFITLYQVNIDTDEKTEIASFVLSAIRNIYYHYDYDKLDLIFEFGDYLVNLYCNRFD